MRICRGQKVLDMLGMARRAGTLLVGQDKVLPAIKRTGVLAVFLTNDCSENVLRHAESAAARGSAEIFLLDKTSRIELGAYIGTASAQIAALPAESGFAKKIYTLTCERSDADEQNQSL